MKLVLNILGALLTLAAIWYVGQKMVETGALTKVMERGVNPWVILLAVILGTAGQACLALSWMVQLKALSSNHVPAYPVFNLYAITQLGKYLPGNVVHLIGRYGMTRRLGVSHTGIALSTALEPLLMITIAGVFSLPFVVRWIEGVDTEWLEPLIILGGALLVLGALSIKLAYTRSDRVQELLEPAIAAIISRHTFNMVLLAMCLILIYSALIAFNLALFLDVDKLGWFLFFSASTFAWMLGYVTIGSPGGLGIREVAFLFAVGTLMDQGEIAAGLAISRLTLIASDVVFFGIGIAGRKIRPFQLSDDRSADDPL